MPSLDSYYQPDFSHRSNKPKSKPSTAPQYEIGLDGVPVRSGSKSTNKPIPPRIERKPGPFDVGYKKPDNIVMDVYPEAAADPGRRIYPAQETRKIPGGGEQTGKNLGGGSSGGTPINMSRTFNDLLAGVGQQPFGGTQIPTTMGNPYTATYKQTAGFGDEIPDIGGYNGATYDSEGGRNAVSSRDLSQFEDFTGNEARIAGGSERISQQATGISSSRLSDALNAVQSEVEMTPERRQLMARAAFLDAPDSMSGLRAKEAVNNVVYAGGQHYVPGESADSPAVAINRSDARNIANNKAKAEDFKAKKVAETVAAVKQSPTVLEEVAQTQAFKQDKPQYSQSTPAIGGQIEFENTNPKNTPAFGKTGGYSSGFTRIDTSMTNPFG